MKNTSSKLSASILVMTLALILVADDTRGFFVGMIESIDVPHRVLNVKGATSSMTFAVAADAKVYGADKKELTLPDLKVGQEVTVDYTLINGLAVAHTITLKEPAPPPLPGDKPAPL